MGELDRRAFLRLGAAGGAALGLGGLLAACGDDDGGSASTTTTAGDAASTTAGGGGASGPAGPDSVMLTDDEITDIQGRGLRIGFNTNNNTDDFSATVVRGGEAEAEALGIELITGSADFDAQRQLGQVDALVQQGVDAIFLIAVDADAISASIINANDAGIPVIIVGGPPTRGEVISVLNAQSYQGCLDAAGALAAAMGGSGQAGVLKIPLPLDIILERDRGTEDGLTGGGIEIVADQGSFDQDELLSQAQGMIQANPELGGIFATWSLAINAALAAAEEADGQILIAGHDAERPGFEAFEAGNESLVALTAQQPFLQGQVGLRALCKSILGQSVAPDLQVDNILVTPDNYRDVWDTLYPGIDAPWA